MRLFRPLRRARVPLLWGGLATSAVGDQVYIVAIAWIGVLAFGPRAGWLNALGAFCTLVTVLFAGPWIDQVHPVRAMAASDAFRALVLVLVVAAWSAGLPLPVWAGLLVLAVVVLGIGRGVFHPALQDVMPATVADAALLPAANALFDSTDRIARLLGPGLIGLLSAFLSPVWFLLLDAGTFVVSAVCVRRVGAGLPPLEPRPARPPVRTALLRGYRAMFGHPILGWQMLMAAPLNGTWMATFYLALPLLVEQHHLAAGVPGAAGSGFGAYGLVLLGYGCTNVLGNVVVGNRDMPARPARQFALAYACMGAGMAAMGLLDLLALSPPVRLACYVGCAAVSAISGPLQDIPGGVLRQTALPRADVPAAMRAYMATTGSGTLLALLAAPLVLSAAPVGAFVAACGLVNLLSSAATLVRDLRRPA